jgi:hypothetical protein
VGQLIFFVSAMTSLKKLVIFDIIFINYMSKFLTFLA